MPIHPRVDHVVVGAGSAGCVVAARLSEDLNRSVLLIEAGPSLRGPGVSSRNFFAALGETGRIWPDLNVQLVEGGPSRPYLRGMGLGGSSAVNAMVGVWGQPDDYARWEPAAGPGWGPCRLPFTPWAVPPERWGAVGRALVAASLDAGHSWAAGPDTIGSEGISPAHLTWSPATGRISAVDAYLSEASHRPNLSVVTESPVERVLLQGRNAVGVRLVDGHEIEAGHVTVCAGAIHTPQLLLRSGVDTPGVGQRLKDHPGVGVTLELHPQNRATADSFAVGTLLRLSAHEPADLQILPLNMAGMGEHGERYGLLRVALMLVQSTGTVTEDAVAFRLFSDERDRQRLRIGARQLFSLARAPAFASIASAIYVDDVGTPLESLLDADDDDVDSWMLRTVGDYMHACGTCAIGTVVDRDAHVRGYRCLAVVDASVFPDLPRANTHLTTLMVAERLSARIRTATST